MKRLAGLLLAGLVAIASGCGPTSPSATSGAGQTDNGDSIEVAYQLIVQKSVDPVDAGTVATAGVNGLRVALLQDGVTPPEVDVPTFTKDATQDTPLLQDSVQLTIDRYASKLTPSQADDAVIGAMAKSVGDCHTTYFTPDQFKQQLAWVQGQMQFGGIGASLRKTRPSDPLMIWRVFAGTPAAKAGLKEGDVIQAVDGQDVSSYSVQAVVDLIRGPVGKTVQLTIQPVGQSSIKVVSIVRNQIQPPNVEYRMLPNQVGYVQLYGFPENVAGQMKQALDGLDRQGARSWIIDVRDNGGGAIDSVTQVLSMFVPKNTLLFYLYDSTGKRTNYLADGSVRSHLPPMVVLTNDGTGSGAEIFAATLQDQGLAKVVGTQTAGCVGTGQLFSLPSGGGIQVAVAKLLTGQGRVLNQVGVTPDIATAMTVQDLTSGKDPQLQRADQLLQTGR
ncbi:MAG: S41 family peptidase [Chloroflexota bacterium]